VEAEWNWDSVQNNQLLKHGLYRPADHDANFDLHMEDVPAHHVQLLKRESFGFAVRYFGPTVSTPYHMLNCCIFINMFTVKVEPNSPLLPYPGHVWDYFAHEKQCEDCRFFLPVQDELVICSKIMGGIARFINADCSPNCHLAWGFFQGHDKKLPLVVSNQQINPGNANVLCDFWVVMF